MSTTTADTKPGFGAGDLLQLFRDGRARTRADLVRETGLARSTIRARIESLLEAGYLSEDTESETTRGRPAGRLVWNPGHASVVGIDVGATHATVAVLDLQHTVLTHRTVPVTVADGPEVVLDAVGRLGVELLGDRLDSLAGVGIGLPGPVEHSTGRPTSPPIMPGWDGYDVPERLGGFFGAPVLVDNDVNVMALGEHAVVWPEQRHLLFVKVATGIGSGIISEGQLNRGAVGTAGDLGHVALPEASSVRCHCGNLGCLEAVAAAGAQIGRLTDAGLQITSLQDVVDAVRHGHPDAVAVMRQAGRDLGTVLATCVSLLNPGVIVIGGKLSEAGAPLLAGVREVVYQRSIPLATSTLRIASSQAGPLAGVLGAGTMVADQVLAPASVEARLAQGQSLSA